MNMRVSLFLVIIVFAGLVFGQNSDTANFDVDKGFENAFFSILEHKLNYDYKQAFDESINLLNKCLNKLEQKSYDSRFVGYSVATMLVLRDIADECGMLTKPEYAEIMSKKTRDARLNALLC